VRVRGTIVCSVGTWFVQESPPEGVISTGGAGACVSGSDVLLRTAVAATLGSPDLEGVLSSGVSPSPSPPESRASGVWSDSGPALLLGQQDRGATQVDRGLLGASVGVSPQPATANSAPAVGQGAASHSAAHSALAKATAANIWPLSVILKRIARQVHQHARERLETRRWVSRY
jgi:hypothetical protein